MLSRVIRVTLSCLFLTTCLVASAKADVVENLVFTGTATCGDTFCASFGSGPLTGAYSLDVTTQTIVGPWSFSTPFGVISSNDPGASTLVMSWGIYTEAYFDELTSPPPFFEFVQFIFPGTDTQQIGAVTSFSNACQNLPGTVGCKPVYTVAGSNALVPEPSGLTLLGIGMLGLVGLGLKKSLYLV